MPAPLEAHDAPVFIGAVTLRVHDLPALTAWYRDAIGLRVLHQDAGSADLGVGGRVLVRLEAGAGQPTSTAGLFHLAILLPSRHDLANWLRHAAQMRLPLDGASDHLVSEALYLTDPEGNGIEIYRDRKRAEWPLRPDGGIAMATERLDLDALIGEADAGPYAGMPAGTGMGHVHLRVGDTAAAEAFYRDLIGFELMVRYPGASFLATGGYHHHIAGNIWGSRGAGPRRPGEAGLDRFELIAPDAADFAGVRERILAAGGDEAGGVPAIADPWGNRLVLVR
ncbi:VOC family protein [Bosea sp. (in: a-proteobacteria)]|uniref:VOC family protein n=1 Tax=Bosea sp. (in: a-proteobacteria) TaxID=1871050 RepID=UPI00260AD330|nr:VOC family protein [Bosea sp. (in: a-proteobacteria)]MCO5090434.1 VOC family protein [Bosea sp. (in: a-proteobacteria)]